MNDSLYLFFIRASWKKCFKVRKVENLVENGKFLDLSCIDWEGGLGVGMDTADFHMPGDYQVGQKHSYHILFVL